MKNKGISIREILIITFGMFLVAAGVYFFMRECETFSVNNVLEGLLW